MVISNFAVETWSNVGAHGRDELSSLVWRGNRLRSSRDCPTPRFPDFPVSWSATGAGERLPERWRRTVARGACRAGAQLLRAVRAFREDFVENGCPIPFGERFGISLKCRHEQDKCRHRQRSASTSAQPARTLFDQGGHPLRLARGRTGRGTASGGRSACDDGRTRPCRRGDHEERLALVKTGPPPPDHALPDRQERTGSHAAPGGSATTRADYRIRRGDNLLHRRSRRFSIRLRTGKSTRASAPDVHSYTARSS